MTSPKSPTLYEELAWRGFVYQKTSEDLPKILEEEKIIPYIGFDPSASSLHVGNLVPLMLLLHFRRYGHQVIPLQGGGTGLIGDPSGKSKERPLLTNEEVKQQGKKIAKQMRDFLSKVDGPKIIEQNNIDWLGSVKLIEFLRDVGKHFPVGEMMRKDSVQLRFEKEDVGISFTEFSYMLLQAYDALELYRRTGCRLQCGASDQWGNIVCGVELIRRMEGVETYGLTMPLLTKADGTKFGKTESRAVWLDPQQTSPYGYYQFFFNTADDDCEKMLKFFTLLDQDAIADLTKSIGSPDRIAQKTLAKEATALLHGEKECVAAINASAALFSGRLAELPVGLLKQIASDVPSTTVSAQDLKKGSVTLFDALVRVGAVPSKSEAKRAVTQGGVKINGVSVDSPDDRPLTASDFREKKVLVVQKGKKFSGIILIG